MLVTYRGSCHCGAVRFSFDGEPITTGKRCNCSLCSRRGAVMSTPYFERVTIEGMDALALYHWGDRSVNHYFCKTCGIYTFHEAIDEPGRYRVNLGCVEGVDPLAVEISIVDGRAF